MSGNTQPKPIVILISGRGSNMRAIIERSRAPNASFAVSKVLSDKPGAAGLELARSLFGITAQGVPHTGDTREAFDRLLARAIDEASPALIVLAGYMRILSAEFVAHFRGRILNIHPSLLPKFPGLHTHRRALEAFEAEHGATVHFVTEELDGGPAIIQAQVPVRPDDTEASLAIRVQTQEHQIYPRAIDWFCCGRLRFEDGKAVLDGKVLNELVQFSEGSELP